jgi:hypothetical protein
MINERVEAILSVGETALFNKLNVKETSALCFLYNQKVEFKIFSLKKGVETVKPSVEYRV